MDPRQQSVHDAWQAARTALGAMLTADDPSGLSAVSVSGSGTPASAGPGARTRHDRARYGWHMAERFLQALTARTDLEGQSIIAEARRQQRLSLEDAHALAALHHWADRSRDESDGLAGVSNDAEHTVAREALQAVDHASSAVGAASDAPAGGAHAYIDNVAALGATPPRDSTPGEATGAPSVHAPPPSAQATPRNTRHGWRSPIVIGTAAVLLVAALAVTGWAVFAGRGTDSLYRDAVAAYQRGSYETARVAFARVAQERPDDARPLIFLGRIAREERDMARSRRFLEAAVRLEPQSALAQRELAGTLLADGQPELARRFYVRAVELDPTDRAAQGFLGCALHRLSRFEEARRWFDRAGPGDWMQCIGPMPAPGPGSYPPQAVAPYPGPPRPR